MPPKRINSDDSPSRASHSRDSSSGSARHAHAPATPSQLRQAHAPSDRSSSPEEFMHPQRYYDDEPQPSSSGAPLDLGFSTDGILPAADDASAHATHETAATPQGGIIEIDLEPTVRARLRNHQNWDVASGCGDPNCNHGTTSPRPEPHRNYGSFAGSMHSVNSFGGAFPGDAETTGEGAPTASHPLLGNASVEGSVHSGNGQKSTTKWLADRHGVKNQRLMYLQYYIPILNWTQQYKWQYLKGDLIAAITMASFYIPMSLSYASNLAHVPPVHGLYSFALNPLIYAVLGTCPQMIVGPEAPGSLLVGEIVRENIKKGTTGDNDGRRNAEIAGIVTSMAGAFILMAGIFRLGFLDNVLSRPFLRGFISAIGVVIFIDQLIPEMGLARLAADQVSHGSCIDKVVFLFRNAGNAHGLTCAMSFTAFGVIMFFRYVASVYNFCQPANFSKGVQETSTTTVPLCRLYSRPISCGSVIRHLHLEISARPAGPCCPRECELQRRQHLRYPLPIRDVSLEVRTRCRQHCAHHCYARLLRVFRSWKVSRWW
jgi:hypothetical protein